MNLKDRLGNNRSGTLELLESSTDLELLNEVFSLTKEDKDYEDALVKIAANKNLDANLLVRVRDAGVALALQDNDRGREALVRIAEYEGAAEEFYLDFCDLPVQMAVRHLAYNTSLSEKVFRKLLSLDDDRVTTVRVVH